MDDETVYLVAGVQLYEKGCWSKILNKFSKHFNNRNQVQLKDKYRNLEAQPILLKTYETKAKIIIDEMSKKD